MPTLEPTSLGAPGEAYLKALTLRGIDTDVGYYDPTRPAPALDTKIEPEASQNGDGEASNRVRLQVGLPALLILIGVVVLFVRFGGGFSVSLAREPGSARRGERGGAVRETGAMSPLGLGGILATADRRDALMSLTAAALARAIEAQGLLFQKSWTARDVLRNLPPETPLHEDLRALVFASERVHFGGRDVSEEEFRAHVTRIRPLLEGAR